MGASSGLIVAFVVAVWAAYFVPLVLRRYDEAGKTAAIEASGESGRVISPTARSSAPVENRQADEPEMRPATRLAARRRRRTLLTLIAALVVTTAVSIGGVAPLWSIAIPAALIVAWLVACRVQVRGELDRRVADRTETDNDDAHGRSIEDEDTIVLSGHLDDLDPARPHVMESTPLAANALDDHEVIAVPSVSTHGDALWDPLPITVPTYVTKPRAGRTIRTIDFNQAGTWTSGHVEGENTELPEPRDEGESLEGRRAVGG